MPKQEDHLNQVSQNKAFLQSINRTAYPDWAITVIFYTALHYIDALLAKENVHPGSHDRRDNYVTRRHELRTIAKDYFRLKNSSRTARYNPPTKFTHQNVDQLEMTHLKNIETQITPLLGST